MGRPELRAVSRGYEGRRAAPPARAAHCPQRRLHLEAVATRPRIRYASDPSRHGGNGERTTHRRQVMKRFLAYTSPARGHLYPLVDTLIELRRRGHEVSIRTLAAEVPRMRQLGFSAAPIA